MKLTIDADYAKCEGPCCSVRQNCLRFVADSRNPNRQVMMEPTNPGPDCRYYWPITEERSERKD